MVMHNITREMRISVEVQEAFSKAPFATKPIDKSTGMIGKYICRPLWLEEWEELRPSK